VGEVGATDRFTRGGRRPGQFVGSDTTDLPSFMTQLAGAVGGQGSNLNQLRGRNQQGQRGQNPNNPNQQAGRGGMGGRMNQQQAQYRVSRSVGFNYALPATAELRTQLGTRLQRLPGVSALGPIDVTLQERTIVLRGSVATAHDRDLAERLALLEAGVDQVQNELTIAPPAMTAPPLAAPASTSAARPAGSAAN
jgi:osmotically-inducible protein OsmY